MIALDQEEERRILRRSSHIGPWARMLLPYPRSLAQAGPEPVAVMSVRPADMTPSPREYLSHTHDLMVRACSLRAPARSRSFAAEVCWDDEVPLHPGDRHVVTITVRDDNAPAFLGAGQRFTLWDGSEVGHGTISRQVFTEYGPC